MIVYILIFLNLIFYFFLPKFLNNILDLNYFFFEYGFYWQIISSMFLHGSLEHLIFNMIVLFQFGLILEKYIGKFRFLILYFCGGIFSSISCLFYIYFFNNNANILGASGAICALMGAYSVYDKNSLKGLIVALLLISFIPLFFGANVAWYSHIFGFAFGFAFAKIIK